jgi:transitional endoplasmic reticulum ATPase
LVARARELIEAPLKHHALLREIKAKPVKGVLFAGESGTGKTMLARIIASEAGATFFLVNGPDIISKWYGDSQRILGAIFRRAMSEDRAIIFFDELDSIAGHRTDESHEESQRVVARLLTLMDGFTLASNLIIIAATNRPKAIDKALLRPGRFDWQLNFPLPDLDSREAILRAACCRLSAQGDLPHDRVAAKTEGWTGADLTAIFSEAALLAAKDGRSILITEDYLAGHERAARARQEKSARNERAS